MAAARRRAFTLVELLVVVGIISVLIALLMPVLGRAREHARRVKCAANLHAIGHGLMMYVQQYGYYPGTFTQDRTLWQQAYVWPPRLRPFLSDVREVFLCPSQDEQARWDLESPLPLKRCQGEVFPVYGYEPGEPLIHQSAYFSYGYNGQGYDSRGGNNKGLGFVLDLNPPSWMDTTNTREVRGSRVIKPAEMIAIADSKVDGNADGYIDPSQEFASPGRIHNGGANILFCDGHVSWYHTNDLIIRGNMSDPRDQFKARMWNNDNHDF